ncbi:hypothetical protein ACFXB4_00075 [Streptomyces lavendulae]|uniref:hypothetical protein n=1 Tax=Streptomyces lavendulae TaxID=1914 RepID=UPI0036C5B58A
MACSQTGPQPAVLDAGDDGVRIPPGQVVVDIPLCGLRVGDRVLSGGRLVAIADQRYRHGGTRTMILTTGRVAAAERTGRVCRPLVWRVVQLGGWGSHPASAVALSVLV